MDYAERVSKVIGGRQC